MTEPRILLVAMPWQRADAPSLQLGLLKTGLASRGFRADCLHAAPRLSKLLGRELYWRVANNLHPLLGEAFFAAVRRADFPFARFEKDLTKSEELERGEWENVFAAVRRFCSDLEAENLWARYDVVGFSCTFNQLQASLWAAASAKKHGCRVVFGGFLTRGNFGRELLNNSFIDAVIAGPGETGLPTWLESGRRRGYFDNSTALPLPLVPDYDDYFSALSERERRKACLIMESSRGCEHDKCAFCAQNSMSGRHCYSSEYVADCLEELAKRHPCREIEFADTSFPFPLLSGLGSGRVIEVLRRFTAFAECRVPKSGEMAGLAKAGILNVQVGIESLQEDILRRMRKGATLLDNVRCLRESWEYGIFVGYNIILDMPGTTPNELHEMTELLPRLHHLPPPTSLVPFQLQRDSDVYKNPQRYQVRTIFSHQEQALLGDGHPPFYFGFSTASAVTGTDLQVAHTAFNTWSKAYNFRYPLLRVKFQKNNALVFDARPSCESTTPVNYQLAHPHSSVLRDCLPTQSKNRLKTKYGDAIHSVLAELSAKGLILEKNQHCLSLPVPLPTKGRLPVQRKREPLDSYFTDDNETV
jgi:ribosomal peptide maturation radical SAM protein 1